MCGTSTHGSFGGNFETYQFSFYLFTRPMTRNNCLRDSLFRKSIRKSSSTFSLHIHSSIHESLQQQSTTKVKSVQQSIFPASTISTQTTWGEKEKKYVVLLSIIEDGLVADYLAWWDRFPAWDTGKRAQLTFNPSQCHTRGWYGHTAKREREVSVIILMMQSASRHENYLARSTTHRPANIMIYAIEMSDLNWEVGVEIHVRQCFWIIVITFSHSLSFTQSSSSVVETETVLHSSCCVVFFSWLANASTWMVNGKLCCGMGLVVSERLKREYANQKI